MYCPNCGNQLNPNGSCPVCSVNPPTPAPAPVTVQPTETNPQQNKNGKEPGKFAKGYAALFTALLVFPGSLCAAIDLSFHSYDFWFGYVVGALIVVWVCAVLPVMKITPAPVTAVICLISIFGYISFLMSKLGDIPFVQWLYARFLPLLVLAAIFVAIDVALISSKKFDWMKILSAMSFEIGMYFIALEFTFTKDLANLHWSPIAACGFISVAAVLLAFSFIWKTNKKQ